METTNTNEIFETLSTLIDKKATIFKFSEMGFPQTIQCKILDVYRKNYAQYDNCLHVNYLPKGKRTAYVFRIYADYVTFAVFAGHVLLNANMFISSKESGGLVISESLVCFSDEYLTRALSSTDQKPVLVQSKELEPV